MVPRNTRMRQSLTNWRWAASVITAAVIFPIVARCGRLSPTEPESLVVEPACSNPAPLHGADHRAYPNRVVDEYLVLLQDRYTSAVEGNRLATKYGFAVTTAFTLTPAFAADLRPETVRRFAVSRRSDLSNSQPQTSLLHEPRPTCRNSSLDGARFQPKSRHNV